MRNKKVVRLTESQLHNIIAESVYRILSEQEQLNEFNWKKAGRNAVMGLAGLGMMGGASSCANRDYWGAEQVGRNIQNDYRRAQHGENADSTEFYQLMNQQHPGLEQKVKEVKAKNPSLPLSQCYIKAFGELNQQ